MIQNSKNQQAFTNFDYLYQIWYNEETRKQCFDGFTLFHNPSLTPFFENSIILNIFSNPSYAIPAQKWVGIFSPKFFQKAYGGFTPVTPKNIDDFLSRTNKEVVGFNIKLTQPNIITQGDRWHPGFTEVFKMIIEKAGIDYDIRKRSRIIFTLKTGHNVYANIMSNYVIAKAGIYKRYVDEVLRPCMQVMSDENNTDIWQRIWRDSGYQRLQPRAAKADYLQKQIGVPYYPYHTFICERFWTMFMNMNTSISMTHFPYE